MYISLLLLMPLLPKFGTCKIFANFFPRQKLEISEFALVRPSPNYKEGIPKPTVSKLLADRLPTGY